MAGRRGGGGQICFLAAVERPLLLRCSTGSGDQTWRFRSRKLGDDFQRRMIESEQQNQIVVELIANLTADQLAVDQPSTIRLSGARLSPGDGEGGFNDLRWVQVSVWP